jgi:hypothetical protein
MARLAMAGGVIWPPIFALLLATCGTGEASPGGVQAKQGRGEQLVARVMEARRNDDRGDLRVVTRPAPGDWCGMRETTRLVVLRAGREVTTQDYCSAYNRGGASLVTDARGEPYVLLTYGTGHGDHATTDWLKIFRFADGDLMERANLRVKFPAGMGADHVFNYRTDTPPGGGLVVSGAWFADEYGTPAVIPLPGSRTIVALDTAREEATSD